jgi:hypothetical protein
LKQQLKKLHRQLKRKKLQQLKQANQQKAKPLPKKLSSNSTEQH